MHGQKNTFFALGVAFAYDSTTSYKINFEEKLLTLKNALNLWTTRNLTLIGRICIVKTLAISKLVYNTSVFTMPPNFTDKVNDICFKFIWNFKPDKVKRQTIILPGIKAVLIWLTSTYWKNRLKQLGSNVYMKLTVVNGVPSSPLLYLNMGVGLSLIVISTHAMQV